MSSCTIGDCTKQMLAKGMCSSHYSRNRDHGSPYSNGVNPIEDVDGEEWRPVVGYEGIYSVSNIGRIKSHERLRGSRYGNTRTVPERVMSLARNGRYKQVILTSDYDTKPFLVHRLVAIAFIPNPKKCPQVNHIDGNRYNNEVSNLEWCDAKKNMQHAYRNGLIKVLYGDQHPKSVLNETQVKEIITMKGKKKQVDVARVFGVSRQTVAHIWRGTTWKHLADDRSES